MKKVSIILAVAFAALFQSCHKEKSLTGPENPAAVGDYSVEYTVAGGFAGGIHTRMSINGSGNVVLHSASPVLNSNLTATEQAVLTSFSKDIWNQPDTLHGGCMDDFTFLIQWTDAHGTKTVSADGCALWPPLLGIPYPILSGLIQTLDNIATRVFQEAAPWRGMQAEFTIDDSSYSLDKPITLTYTLTNPSTSTKTLYFQHADQFRFSVSRDNFPGFHYTYPLSSFDPMSFSDTSSPSTIELKAGQQKKLVYVWDHATVDAKGVPGTLGVGTYHLEMALLAGDFAPQYRVFDLYDKSIPVKGEIVPDYSGADQSSSTYTFQLRVTNWTGSPVTLHFENSQRIAVELWDLDFDPPKNIIYTTPTIPPGASETRLLAPHESVVFADTVVKSAMMPGYFWSLAKVRLLCTDFEFRRDAQLQISHN